MKKLIVFFLLFFPFQLLSVPPPHPRFLNDSHKQQNYIHLRKQLEHGKNTIFKSFQKTAVQHEDYTYPDAWGHKKILVILIDFTNKPHSSSHDKNYFYDLIFNKSSNSMYHYYYENSYHTFELDGTTADIYGWYQSSHTMEYYGENWGSGVDNRNGSITNMIIEAVDLAYNDINFSEYDADNNGILDFLLVVHAGGDEANGSDNDIYSHNYFVNTQRGGVKIRNYATVSEESPLGIFCHEFGHSLGALDLYKTTSYNTPSVAGKWALMDYGLWNADGEYPANFISWHKILFGWIEPVLVTNYLSSQDIPTISDSSADTRNVVFKVKHSEADDPDNEYYLINNRQKTGTDSHIPGSGILIWHIDDSVGGSLEDNEIQEGPHPRVQLVPADNTYISSFNKGESSDAWYSNSEGLTASSTPNNAAYNGKTMKAPVISEISASSAIMTATFLKYSTDKKIIVFDEYDTLTQNSSVSLEWSVTDTNSLDVISSYRVINENINEIKNTTELQAEISVVSGLNYITVYALDNKGGTVSSSKTKLITKYTVMSKPAGSDTLIIDGDTVINNITDWNGKNINAVNLSVNFINNKKDILIIPGNTGGLDFSFNPVNSNDTWFCNVNIKKKGCYLSLSAIDTGSDLFKKMNISEIDPGQTTLFNIDLIDTEGNKVSSDFLNYTGYFTFAFKGSLLKYSLDKYMIRYFSETDNTWKDDLTLYTSNGYIFAKSDHLTPIMLTLNNSAVISDNIIIYPNPFKPYDHNSATGDYSTGINFLFEGTSRTLPAEIKIYTVIGELVKNITVTSKDYDINLERYKVKWDCANSDNKHAASGVYIALLKSNSGKAVGKFVIIR